jgi:acyl carrier protein
MKLDEDKKKIRELIAVRLKLAAEIEKISNDTPLFAPDGLALDSIDALELVLGLQKEFNVVIEDRITAVKVLATINSIAEFVQSHGKV